MHISLNLKGTELKTTISILLLVLFFSVPQIGVGENWQQVDTNIHYKEVVRNYSWKKSRTAKYHVLRIKQGTYKLSVKSFHNLQQWQTTGISELREKNNYLIVLSGGFFDPDFKKPVGLIVEKQKKVFNLTSKLSGVIWIKNNHLYLSPTDAFAYKKMRPDYAIQGYPRIVDPVNKPGIYKQSGPFLQRTAIGLSGDYIIIMITDKLSDGVSLYELAMFAQTSEKKGGLNCDIAVNLDGGPAPGISVSPELKRLEVKEEWQVPNVFIIEKQ